MVSSRYDTLGRMAMETVIEFVVYIGIVVVIMAAFAGVTMGIFKNLSQ